MEVKLKFNDINVKEEKEKTLVKVLMLKGEKGDKGDSATWGEVGGTLSNQTDLQNALNSKANQTDLNTTNQTVTNIENELNDKIETKTGSSIVIDDTIGIKNLKIYGDTNQEETPTTSNPTQIKTVTGDVTVNVGENSYILPLNNLELCKIDNYKDYIYNENGNWYIAKKIKKIVLNGTETGYGGLNLRTNTTRMFLSKNLNDMIRQGYCYSTYCNYLEAKDVYNNDVEGFFVHYPQADANSNLYISIPNTIATTKAEVLDWISNHNLVIYYPLKDLNITQITDKNLIRQLNAILNSTLNESETISISFSDLSPTLEITFYKNTISGEIEENKDISKIFEKENEKENLYCFDTLDDLKKCNLELGDTAKIIGNNLLGDGQNAIYKIIADQTEIALDNGLYAQLINNLDKMFYDEITYTKERYYDTDCYFVTIPKRDNENKIIMPYIGDGGGTETPLTYAQKNNTTFTSNGTLFISDTVDSSNSGNPIVIHDGQVIKDHPMISPGVADNYLYLGITEDRQIKEYKVNTTNAQTMLDDGCIEVFDIYYKLIEDGLALDLTNVVTNEPTVVSNPNPRIAICLNANEDIIIFACDGRTEHDIGLTSTEMQELFIQKGYIQAWNMDGGGSTNITLKGSKLNRNIDSNGTVDRKIRYTLNVKKPTTNKGIAEIYSKIGEEKQNIIQQIIPYFYLLNSKIGVKDISNENLNNLVGENITGYGNSVINGPKNNGYFINFNHSSSEYANTYNAQIFIHRDSNHMYFRTQRNGTFEPWQELGRRSYIIAKVSTNKVLADETYQAIKFNEIITEDTSHLIVDDTSLVDVSYYTRFKLIDFSSARLKISANLDYEAKTTGTKYVRLLKNNSTVLTLRAVTLNADERGQLSIDFVGDFSENDVFSLEVYGSENDLVNRTILMTDII